MNQTPDKKEVRREKDILMLDHICRNQDVILKDVGLMHGLSGSSVLEGIRRVMLNSGARLSNGKPPRTVIEIKSCYSEYLRLRG